VRACRFHTINSVHTLHQDDGHALLDEQMRPHHRGKSARRLVDDWLAVVGAEETLGLGAR
jgi:hypothetical protein